MTADDATAGDEFGKSVAIDGNMILIGAWGDDKNGNDSGSAYIFTRSGTTWNQHTKLIANDAAAGDYFGVYVALEGNTAIIGAWKDDDGGDDSGSAYIFTRSGTAWNQHTKITANDAEAGDYFGKAVSLVSGRMETMTVVMKAVQPISLRYILPMMISTPQQKIMC